MIVKKKSQHLICSLICLPCGKHHRVEIGVPEVLSIQLAQDGTFAELLDEAPEVLMAIEEDEFMKWVFQHFIAEHGKHDIRFINTLVPHMAELVNLRQQHFKRMILHYEKYRDVIDKLKTLESYIPKKKPPRSQPRALPQQD